jgi:hypothetical protein
MSTDTFCIRRPFCAPPEGGLLTFNQLAEYLIWAVLQPPGVDVYTIIVRCCGATI